MVDVTKDLNIKLGEYVEMPIGAMCDIHNEVSASFRVAAEMDSKGVLLLDICDSCNSRLTKNKKH